VFRLIGIFGGMIGIIFCVLKLGRLNMIYSVLLKRNYHEEWVRMMKTRWDYLSFGMTVWVVPTSLAIFISLFNLKQFNNDKEIRAIKSNAILFLTFLLVAVLIEFILIVLL
jgi:hypothetical protein